MTKAHREHHPLLYDDLSEEEQFSLHRRSHPMAFRSRVRNKVRGAASILKRWPGYWSSALIYWWIGLGMILITTLLIYNGLTVFALLPPERNITPMIRTDNFLISPRKRTSYLPEVFMHVFKNLGDEMDLNAYVPYIEKFKNQFNDYKYHLVIVWNDTATKRMVSAEESNDIALNSIFYDSNTHEKKDINGVITEQINLTKYLDSSPLRKHWRNIPYQFIKFMIRAIAIWDKGGIAFNPIILTSKSPSYLSKKQKLQHVLEKYIKQPNNDDVVYNFSETGNSNGNQKQTQRLNNIRDIINAMEQADENQNNIGVKENKDLFMEVAESRFLSPVILNILNDTKMVIEKLSGSLLHYKDQENKKNRNMENSKEPINVTSVPLNINTNNETLKNDNVTIFGFLPADLTYLLNGKNIEEKSKTENIEITPLPYITRKRKSVINTNKMRNNKKENKGKLSNDDKIVNDEVFYMPMIVPANKTTNDITKVTKKYGYLNLIDNSNRTTDQLTIDLNGNILATNTSCHAFIGTLFSNIVHHEREETVTDFIISELTSFCKGLLSSCDGIDVILL